MGRFKVFALALACGALLAAGCGQTMPALGSDQPLRPVVVKGAEEQGAGETQLADHPPMVRIKGELYLDTGRESDVGARCGVMDGEITSAVAEGKLPTEDDQSNFGTGYEYQFVSENGVDIVINQKWMRFEKERPHLTLEQVLELAKKGDALSWADFAPYHSIETGSGLYIRLYPIDESLNLMIGGVPGERPMYIYLARADKESYVDIRTGDIEAFLAREPQP